MMQELKIKFQTTYGNDFQTLFPFSPQTFLSDEKNRSFFLKNFDMEEEWQIKAYSNYLCEIKKEKKDLSLIEQNILVSYSQDNNDPQFDKYFLKIYPHNNCVVIFNHYVLINDLYFSRTLTNLFIIMTKTGNKNHIDVVKVDLYNFLKNDISMCLSSEEQGYKEVTGSEFKITKRNLKRDFGLMIKKWKAKLKNEYFSEIVDKHEKFEELKIIGFLSSSNYNYLKKRPVKNFSYIEQSPELYLYDKTSLEINFVECYLSEKNKKFKLLACRLPKTLKFIQEKINEKVTLNIFSRILRMFIKGIYVCSKCCKEEGITRKQLILIYNIMNKSYPDIFNNYIWNKFLLRIKNQDNPIIEKSPKFYDKDRSIYNWFEYYLYYLNREVSRKEKRFYGFKKIHSNTKKENLIYYEGLDLLEINIKCRLRKFFSYDKFFNNICKAKGKVLNELLMKFNENNEEFNQKEREEMIIKEKIRNQNEKILEEELKVKSNLKRVINELKAIRAKKIAKEEIRLKDLKNKMLEKFLTNPRFINSQKRKKEKFILDRNLNDAAEKLYIRQKKTLDNYKSSRKTPARINFNSNFIHYLIKYCPHTMKEVNLENIYIAIGKAFNVNLDELKWKKEDFKFML